MNVHAVVSTRVIPFASGIPIMVGSPQPSVLLAVDAVNALDQVEKLLIGVAQEARIRARYILVFSCNANVGEPRCKFDKKQFVTYRAMFWRGTAYFTTRGLWVCPTQLECLMIGGLQVTLQCWRDVRSGQKLAQRICYTV